MSTEFRSSPSSVWSWGQDQIRRYNEQGRERFAGETLRTMGTGSFFRGLGAAMGRDLLRPSQWVWGNIADNRNARMDAFGSGSIPQAALRSPFTQGLFNYNQAPSSPASYTNPRWAADSAVATGNTIYDQIRRGEISQTPYSAIGQVSNSILNANYANLQLQMESANLQAQQHQINMQEIALREALLNGDIEQAKQLIGDINANKAALNQAYQNYYAFTLPHNQQAVADASMIADNNIGAMNQIAAGEVGDKLGAYNLAEHNIVGTADKIGAGDEAAKAALQQVGRDADLHYDAALERSHFANRLLQGEENVAVTGAREAWATDYWQKSMQNQLDDAGMLVRAKKAEQDLQGLENQRAFLDLDKQRANLANTIAMRDIEMMGGITPVSELDFALASASTAMTDAIAKMGMDPQANIFLQSLFQGAMEQGVYTVQDFNKWLNTVVDDQGNTIRSTAGAMGGALRDDEIAILRGAFETYNTARTQYQSGSAFKEHSEAQGFRTEITATSVKAVGKNYRSGTYNQFADAAGYPGYTERANYVTAMKDQIAAAWPGVTFGQWRDKDATWGAENSDHKAGGALDVHGTHEEMMQIARMAMTWPGVGLVKYNDDPDHADHVHISWDIGYFGGK